MPRRTPSPPPALAPPRKSFSRGRAAGRLLAALLLLAAPSTPAVRPWFRLEGSTLTLDTAGTCPLSAVLEEFSRSGVQVYAAPGALDHPVALRARNRPLPEALDALLGDLDYLLTWRSLPGPLGPVPRLKSIEVFPAGRPGDVRRIVPRAERRVVARAADGTEYVAGELLVGVRPGTSYRQFRNLLADTGAVIVDVDSATGAYLLRFPPGTNVEALLPQIAQSPMVAAAGLNVVWRSQTPRMVAPGSALPDFAGLFAPKELSADGTATVAVLDTGLGQRAARDLRDLSIAAYDASSGAPGFGPDSGHGTQMACIAASPSTPVLSVNVFDEEGVTSAFTILQALRYAVANGARVVNMSWGGPSPSEFVENALACAASRDVLLVAAAGNEPTGAPVYPAAYPGVLAVAALDPDGSPAAYSNRGDFVDLAAPGFATTPDGTFAGTSCAAAAVSRELAAWRAAHPDASAADALAALAERLAPSAAPGFGAGSLLP